MFSLKVNVPSPPPKYFDFGWSKNSIWDRKSTFCFQHLYYVPWMILIHFSLFHTLPLSEIFVPRREKNVPWYDQHFMSFLQNEILISSSNFYKYFILMESYISKGTWFYPMSSDCHCTSLKMFVPGYYKNFVGFCYDVFMDHLMPAAGKYDGECVTDHICHSSLLIVLFA